MIAGNVARLVARFHPGGYAASMTPEAKAAIRLTQYARGGG
jgi:hypothetical protein